MPSWSATARSTRRRSRSSGARASPTTRRSSDASRSRARSMPVRRNASASRCRCRSRAPPALQATVVEAGGVSKVEVELDLPRSRSRCRSSAGRRPPAPPAGSAPACSIAPDGPLLVERLELAAAGLEASGSLTLATAPLELEQLLLARFRLGRSSGSLDLHRRDAGGYRVSLRAEVARSRPAARGAAGGRRGEGEGGVRRRRSRSS